MELARQGLVIKSIDKNSIFKYSVLKSTDNIVSVNDIEIRRPGLVHFVMKFWNNLFHKMG
jgi:type II secretory pathway component PulC